MSQSLAQLYVHLVFSTKERRPFIKEDVQPRLHAYISGAFDKIECSTVQVGGVRDHVHILFRLNKNRALAEVVKEAKVESSKWMKKNGGAPLFSWQAGYGAFSVSASNLEMVIEYIRKQEEHHRTRSFEDEFRQLLRRYNLSFDEAYVWD